MPRPRRNSDKIAAYYKRGYSLRETAAKFGISMQRVHQLLLRDKPKLIRAVGNTSQNSRGLYSSQRK